MTAGASTVEAGGTRRAGGSRPWSALGRALVRSTAGGLCLTEPLELQIAGGRLAGAVPARSSRNRALPCIGSPDAVLLPALADSHLHLVATAASRVDADLGSDPPRSIESLGERLRDAASSIAPGRWVRAVGFEPAWLAERRPPRRTELDAWVPRDPLRMRHATRHASFLNGAAFERVVERLGPIAPEHAPRDADGRFEGVVYGLERELTALIGPLPAEAIARALRETSAALARRGVARIDEPSGSNDAARIAFLADAVERGDVVQTLRAFVGDADDAAAAERAARGQIAIAGVKLFAHDAEEARTPRFTDALARARRAGLPVAVHAVEADCVQAVAEALAAAPERARRSTGIANVASFARLPASGASEDEVPDRIEHASLCPPELARRLASQRIAVVTQPGFLVARGAKYRAEVEEPLWPWLYPLRSLLAAGVLVAGGSDSPVASADPRIAFLGAMDRSAPGEPPIGPEEAIGEDAVLDLFTRAAARLRGEPSSIDWPTIGACADFAVLARDPTRSRWQDLEAVSIAVAGVPHRLHDGPGGLEIDPVERS